MPTAPTTAGPACCPNTGRGRISRRSVLGGLLGGAALTPALGLLGGHVAYAAAPGWTGDTVVVLSFRGGMDGLSVIVPAGDPAYYRNRPGIAVPAPATIKLDNMFGLHPALAALQPLWNAGQFVPVVATGMASPNRSHFDAMQQMEAAAPGSSTRTGWLGRLVGTHTGQNSTFTAVQVGGGGIPAALRPDDVADSALGIDSVAEFELNGVWGETAPEYAADRAKWRKVLAALHDDEADSIKGSATRTLDALDTAAKVSADYPRAESGNPNPTYPDSDLGKALADTARLIKAKVGLKAATVDVGDWDMHSDLGPADRGWMHDNLADLGAALAAFVADLGPEIQRTTLVTMSEFGRRVEQNNSGGVDHGWGNSMLVIGGNLVGKKVYGSWPTLAEDKLTEGDLTATTDYRAVLADILQHRCAAPTEDLQRVFPAYTGLGSLPGITRST